MENNTTIIDNSDKKKKSSFLNNRGVILILSSNFLGKSFVIDKERTIIGRGNEADIIISDPLVSKTHCAIIVEEDKFFIEDLGSKNFTFLNGKIVKKKTQLFYGDRIIIGDTILRFYLEEAVEK